MVVNHNTHREQGLQRCLKDVRMCKLRSCVDPLSQELFSTLTQCFLQRKCLISKCKICVMFKQFRNTSVTLKQTCSCSRTGSIFNDLRGSPIESKQACVSDGRVMENAQSGGKAALINKKFRIVILRAVWPPVSIGGNIPSQKDSSRGQLSAEPLQKGASQLASESLSKYKLKIF